MINKDPLPISKSKTTYGGLSDQINKVCLSDDLCPVTTPFEDTRAYEVGYRINPGTPGLTVMTYSKFGNEIFEFGSSAFDAPEGAIRSNYQEYKNYMDNLVVEQELLSGTDESTPNPADDLIDKFVPQTLPTFGNLKNESFIKPAPFIELDPENNFLLPSLIGLILIGYFILK